MTGSFQIMEDPPQHLARYAAGGVLVLIAVWWWISIAAGALVLASPWAVVQALFFMTGEAAFYENLSATLLRLAAILCLAGGSGLLLATLAAFDRRIERFVEPFRWLCMTIPPVIVVVVLMFCLGMGSRMIIVFGAGILWPIMYVNVLKGSEGIDADLWEMAQAFRLSWKSRVWNILVPAVMPSILTGMVQVVCGAIRITVLAEVIGANNGIGAAIATTARNLDNARMGAWALVALLLSIGMEFAVLRPLQKKVYRWRPA